MSVPRRLLAVLLAFACLPAVAEEFRFNGHLDDGGHPADGLYDLQLTAFPDQKFGASLSAPLVFERVPVTSGRFQLDFDLPGVADTVWVEVAVREHGLGAYSRIPTRTKAVAALLIGQCWSTTGDSGANPATNFLGTTDATPFEIRTSNARSLRFEPSAETFGTPALPISTNTIGGSHANSVVGGVRGATIAGGGVPSGNSDPALDQEGPNRATDHYVTVSGGFNNQAGDGAGSLSDAAFATVGGGYVNTARGQWSTVGGGWTNQATGRAATVAGGELNSAEGGGTVSGGDRNVAVGIGNTVAGGQLNTARGFNSIVAGGQFGTTLGSNATVSGGLFNCAGGLLSWAGGRQAKVRPGTDPGGTGSCSGLTYPGITNGDAGTFAWADSTIQNFISTGPNQFLVRASGGVVMQKVLGSETVARRPRGFLNVVTGDSGEPQPATPNGSFAVSLESDTNAFVSMLTPAGANRGILFASPGQSTQGAITYVGSLNSLQFTANGQTTMALTNGVLSISGLGAAGSTALCRNGNNQISSCSSSARYKEQIADLGLGLAAALRLRPVGYVWKDGGMADVGFVAEEVAQIDARLVTHNDQGGIEGVKYERLSAVLAGAVQELAARESLQAEAIAQLQAEQTDADRRQAHLESELAELRALVDGLRRERR